MWSIITEQFYEILDFSEFIFHDLFNTNLGYKPYARMLLILLFVVPAFCFFIRRVVHG